MTAVPASGVRLEWVNERLLPFDSRFLTTCGHTIHYVNEGRRSGTPAPPRQCNVVLEPDFNHSRSNVGATLKGLKELP